MAVLGQGLVLMLAGMGIVYVFLVVLIIVTRYTMAFFARFDGILPDDGAKKPAAKKPAAASDDANIALAIAVAMG